MNNENNQETKTAQDVNEKTSTSVSIRGELYTEFEKIYNENQGIIRTFSDLVVPCAEAGLWLYRYDRPQFNEILQKSNKIKN